MSEEKSVRQLERELKAARVRELADHQSKITVSKDFAPIGVDRDNVRKDTQTSTSTPDAIRLPPKRQSKKPNQPYY